MARAENGVGEGEASCTSRWNESITDCSKTRVTLSGRAPGLQRVLATRSDCGGAHSGRHSVHCCNLASTVVCGRRAQAGELAPAPLPRTQQPQLLGITVKHLLATHSLGPSEHCVALTPAHQPAIGNVESRRIDAPYDVHSHAATVTSDRPPPSLPHSSSLEGLLLTRSH